LNQNLSAENLNYRFITFVLCVLDPKLHTLTVVNAGHMPPLRRYGSNGKVEDLGAGEGGLPLGCDPQRGYRQSEVNLVPGDIVLLYTDGISESMNAQGDMYGVEAMRRLISSGPQKLEPLAEALLEDVKRFGQGSLQSDDICLVGFSRVAD
jgi:serine phosphatase RsbU (regulator of sigma subunit)